MSRLLPRENFHVTKQRGRTHTEFGGLAELRRQSLEKLRWVEFRRKHSGDENTAQREELRRSAFNCPLGS